MSWYAFGLFRYSIFLRFWSYHMLFTNIHIVATCPNIVASIWQQHLTIEVILGSLVVANHIRMFHQNRHPSTIPSPLCRPYPDHCRSLGRPRFFGGNKVAGSKRRCRDVPSPTKAANSRWVSELHHLMVQTWRVDSSSSQKTNTPPKHTLKTYTPRFQINTHLLQFNERPLPTSYFTTLQIDL